jgi:hypothetical protein
MAIVLLTIAAAIVGFIACTYSALFIIAFASPSMGYEATLPIILGAGVVGAAVSVVSLRLYQRKRRKNAP